MVCENVAVPSWKSIDLLAGKAGELLWVEFGKIGRDRTFISIYSSGYFCTMCSTDVHLLMAASLVTMIPCLQVFFAAQKYFVESEFSAAVKG